MLIVSDRFDNLLGQLEDLNFIEAVFGQISEYGSMEAKRSSQAADNRPGICDASCW